MRSLRWQLGLLFSLVGTLPTALPARSQARVWQATLDLPVYEEGAPDPNPAFDQFATDRFNYPYTLRKELTGERREHRLRAIYLENEYLKCSVLPDIGGHLYTCIDKISGQPMFYGNSSIKKANIGYRGAWAAFGIEFNFPISHNWMSMSPVDFAYATHDDGSASVTVGNIDRVYGMEWSVELLLRPGSTVLEQRVRLSNRSDVRQRFYWWNNAGVQVWDDSRIEYPMRYTAAHGFAEVQPWPIDAQGKNLSIIKNQTDGPVSSFVHGSREDFMGLWHPHTNTGVAHFARYAELPAKKIWSWGVDADGLDWRKALSDDTSAYAEVQAGLFRNQETYAFLEPGRHIAFSEYWMPVRSTGGISRANLAGVLHLERIHDSLKVSFNANRKFPAATVQLLEEKTSLFNDKIDLDPEQTWTKTLRAPNPEDKYTMELKDSQGALLLRQTEGVYDWTPAAEIKVGPQSNYVVPDESARSEDDWLQFVKSKELNGDKLAALQICEQALKKFPAGFELLKSSGRLLTSLKRFDDAAPRLAAAQARNTTDGEISYYRGIAEEAAGRENNAIDAYEAAARSPEHRGRALLRLAEARARQGKFEEAEAYLAEGLKSSRDDLRSNEELVAIVAAIGRTQESAKQAQALLQRFPLSAFLREEAGKPDLPHLAADPYRVLHLAAQYSQLGLYRKALTVLSRDYPSVPADQHEPGIGLPQENPLVAYARAYCREKIGESASADYALASRLSTLYVFPSTWEDKLALEAALFSNPEDATAHDLLGTWYFARAMTPEALREWDAARRLDPIIPALDANIGMALLHETRDLPAALIAFEDGIKNDPRNVVNYSGAIAAMAIFNQSASARVHVLERYPDPKQMPTSLVYELALNRAEAGDFPGAIALFHDRFFGREEGGTNVRQVWTEVKLLQIRRLQNTGRCADALAEAKNLGQSVPGLAFTRDGLEPILNSPRTNVLLADADAKCGQKSEATAKFEQASKATDLSELLWAWQGARNQPGYDATKWMDRLQAGVRQANANARLTGSRSWWLYTAGMLHLAVGQKEQAQSEFRDVFLWPDTRLGHHLSRLALAEPILP